MLRITSAFLIMISLLLVPTVQAGAPIAPSEIVTIDLLTAELELQLDKLKKLTADAEEFDDNQEKIAQAGGVLACVSQAIVEHKDRKKTKCAAPALRDSGIDFQEAESHEKAIVALKIAQAAWEGKSTDVHPDEHKWDELVDMYSLMEEMEDRNGGISRSVRRPRGRLKERLNASTNAILGLAMLADHNYVEEEALEKDWDKLSHEYIQAMVKLSKALADKDKTQIVNFYKIGNHACDKCHETFRD